MFSFRNCRGFTLVEMLSVIAVVGILAAIIIPVVSGVRERAKEGASLANLRQIGAGLSLYVNDNNGELPLLSVDYANQYWSRSLMPYLESNKVEGERFVNGSGGALGAVFMDPLVEDGNHHSLSDYGANTYVIRQRNTNSSNPASNRKVSTIDNPENLVSVMSAETNYNGRKIGAWYAGASTYVATGSSNPGPSDRGRGLIQALFLDGHVQSIPTEEFRENRESLLVPQ